MSTPFVSNYPTSLDDTTSFGGTADRAFSTLSAGIDIDDTAFTLTSGTLFPADGCVTLTDSLTSPTKTEDIIYSAKSGNNFTVASGGRGAFASDPQDWSTGTVYVRLRLVAAHLTTPNASQIALQTKVGIGASTPTVGKFLVGNTTAGTSLWRVLATGDIPDLSGTYQPLDADLSAIAALTPSNDDILQRKVGVWTNRTIAQVKTDFGLATIATSGSASDLSAGTVPLARLSGITTAELSATAGITNGQLAGSIAISKLSITGTPDGTKYLRDDGSWQAIPGGGDALTSNPLSQFAATTSAQLRGVLSDETGGGLAVFNDSPVLTTPQINDTSADHQYIFAVSELAADRTVTLPLLGAGDTFVFEAHTQTLTNKTLTTPTIGSFTNATHDHMNAAGGGQLAIATAISGLGTGVATALAVNVGSAGAFVVNGGALGTPSSGTLTNATGLPIASGVSGLGANVATFLATPSSANLIAAVTDETGTGALVFATSPTLTTPILGTPTSGTLTNCTGLPLASGVTGDLPFANFVQAGSAGFVGATGAGDYSHRTPTQVTAALDAFVGDAGSGGTKGLVPAPVTGDATKFLRGDGTFQTVSASITVGGAIGGGTAQRVLFEGAGNVLAESSTFAFTPNPTTGDGLAIADSTVTSGNLVSIAASGTAAASNTKTGLLVSASGANATGTQTTFGGRFSNTSTGTTATNVAIGAAASGGTNNYAIEITSGQLKTTTGAVGTPAIRVNDVGLGITRVNANQLSFVASSVSQFAIVSGAVTLNSTAYLSWASTAPEASNPVVGFIRSATDTIRVGAGTTGTAAGNLLLGTSTVGSIGTSGVGVLAIANGTAPGSSPADEFQLYSADWNGAGTAAAHFRNEEGHIVKICSQAVAALTNNVTSGGTNDQITDWTDLTVYATDAAAIRNAIYQLARKLDEVVDAHRANGLFR